MSENKADVWFGDDPQSNTFFFRSPFRSWKFVVSTILLAVVCLVSGLMLWNYREVFKSFPSYVLLLLLFLVVYPYRDALRRHRKIYEHCRSGRIALQQKPTK
jgi:hypothetical protein